MDYDCPQCGEPTPELHEGYCAECCSDNQRRLDAHNAAHVEWMRMTDVQRDAQIRDAIKLGGYAARIER